ncbi:hypothetical protein OsI_00508 [Oryza sativa Indica Group]|uniref:Uncharacterized protein n=1 Tax=Oryza sativa subsp. indica TaxID=39946 RepID=B8ADE7_ORYSI|nr:hypothetical protein OsI_00508 [Oryza sativa Indica Group]
MKPTVNPRPDKMNKRITPSLSCQKLLVSEGADSLGDVEPGVSHCLESGLPHRLTLPSKELLLNDPNWLPCSILPVKLFYERFNQAREVREANSGGISPESLFQERSNDSIWVRVLSCDGMCPVKALCDRLSPRSETSFPNDFGIGPPIELFERSIALKIVKILVNVRVFPLYVIVAIS